MNDFVSRDQTIKQFINVCDEHGIKQGDIQLIRKAHKMRNVDAITPDQYALLLSIFEKRINDQDQFVVFKYVADNLHAFIGL